MGKVYVFISSKRFRSFDEMRSYIDKTYTDDGEGVQSLFMKEVELTQYEPMCIEAIPSETGEPISLSKLLADASYSSQWLSKLDETRLADAAICVFSPNEIQYPDRCSLMYCGEFEYQA